MSDAQLAPDEVAALFPNLAPYLQDGPTPTNGPDPLPANPEHGGVTDEAVQNFINQRYRPLDPRFQAGHGAPPPAGGVEGAATQNSDVPGRVEDAPPAPAPAADPSSPPADQPQDQPSEPTPEPTTEPASDSTLEPDEEIQVPRTQVEAWRQFEELLDNDPRLQQLITEYLTTGRVNPALLVQTPPAAPESTQPQPTATTPDGSLTPPPDLDLDDPTVAALWTIVENQNKQLQLIQSQVATRNEQDMVRHQAETNSIVNRAVTSFQQQHQLDDQQMGQIREVAGRLNLVPVFMSGRDPFTGAPVKPDPIAAVDRALEIAYNQMPDMKQQAQDRILAQRRADDERKRKASSLSGSSGSTPRTQPAPTTPEERRAALVGEVGQMLNGSWSQPE